MTKCADILIINNCPSFYKINLYNALARHCSIHVVFIGLTNQVVINNDFEKDIHFSYELLSATQIEKRNKLSCLIKLISILFSYNYKKIIYGGYVDFEVKATLWFTPKSKNCLQFESSIKESKVSGATAQLKKLFFSRFSVALPSGNLQADVFKALNFKGNIIETKGVGFFNKQELELSQRPNSSDEMRYLYVGRLIALKNLEFLIRFFNQTNKKLTIVGTGVLEKELKQLAHSNITFTGFIPNDEIYKQYVTHDVFILPSYSEPWGLVVEEAIYNGLPVLISEAVGCQAEMVLKPQTGLVFSPHSEVSLIDSMLKIEKNIQIYRSNCARFDFEKRDNEQVNAYLKLLEL